MRPDEALAEGVRRCTMSGVGWFVLNVDQQALWVIEPDTKVDDNDLTFPAIVHMGDGVETSDIALLVERVTS